MSLRVDPIDLYNLVISNPIKGLQLFGSELENKSSQYIWEFCSAYINELYRDSESRTLSHTAQQLNSNTPAALSFAAERTNIVGQNTVGRTQNDNHATTTPIGITTHPFPLRDYPCTGNLAKYRMMIFNSRVKNRP